MFTGIITEMGVVRDLTRRGGAARLVVAARGSLDGAAVGDSVAVNGACLTIVERSADQATFDLVAETLARTTLGRLSRGEAVNLERPMRADGRFDGHFVQGHVDGVGVVTAREEQPGQTALRVRVEPPLTPLLVEKGSVAVDGVSLTVTGVEGDRFSVALIPHTLAVTTLGRRAVGSAVNIETDLLGKHVARLLVRALGGRGEAGTLLDRLREAGFA
ncbi:MAG: riboflavin synthase [Planctomycetes bacterium]|nr:riboflavin synthase [Planctomycetota bacterium]